MPHHCQIRLFGTRVRNVGRARSNHATNGRYPTPPPGIHHRFTGHINHASSSPLAMAPRSRPCLSAGSSRLYRRQYSSGARRMYNGIRLGLVLLLRSRSISHQCEDSVRRWQSQQSQKNFERHYVCTPVRYEKQRGEHSPCAVLLCIMFHRDLLS